MDPEAFLDLANQVTKLKMFPYFDIAHCLLCALSVREDLGTGNKKLNSIFWPLFCQNFEFLFPKLLKFF
jgi:hypothetical protein